MSLLQNLQRSNVIQHEPLPGLSKEVGALTPKPERVVHTLGWVRIEEFTATTWGGVVVHALSGPDWLRARDHPALTERRGRHGDSELRLLQETHIHLAC